MSRWLLSDLPADQGGYLVRTIISRSAAQKAGLELGDIILAVRGRKLSPDDPAASLRRFIVGAGRGKDVPILVRRDDQEVEVVAFWPKKKR